MPTPAVVVPAYDAAGTVGDVVRALIAAWSPWTTQRSLIVVDDGSRDDTARIARTAGALVVCHGRNRGKGAALRTGMGVAAELGYESVVTVDADGQHRAEDAVRLARWEVCARTLVLGVRDLRRAGAPRPNQLSNAISNYFLSRFVRQDLRDTQCGLRRYPLPATLALSARSDGYAFEAEVLLLSVHAGLRIEQVPVGVIYEPDARVTHFHSARDPARIIARVLWTLARRKRALNLGHPGSDCAK